MNQSINQSINESVNQSINQSLKQSSNQSTNQSHQEEESLLQFSLPVHLVHLALVEELPGGADEGFLEVDEGLLDLEDSTEIVDLLHLIVVVLRRRLHFGQGFRRGNEVGVVFR